MLSSGKFRRITDFWLKLLVWLVILAGVVLIQSGAFRPVEVEASINISATVNEPTIEKILPATGPVAGNTSVTINGTNFDNVIAVTFGGVNSSSFAIDSPTSISALTPPGQPGAVRVVVLTEDKAASLNNGFTYIAPVSPTSSPSPTPTVAYSPTNPALTATVSITNTTPAVTKPTTEQVTGASPSPTVSQTTVITTPTAPTSPEATTPESSPIATVTNSPTANPAVTPGTVTTGPGSTLTPTPIGTFGSSPAATLTIAPATTGPGPSPSPEVSPAPTLTPAMTPTSPVISPTSTIVNTPAETPATISPSSTPTTTLSVSPSSTPAVTASVSPSSTPAVTASVSPSSTPAVTASVSPSSTPAVIASVSPSDTLTTTVTATPSTAEPPTSTVVVAPTPTAIVAPTGTPGASPRPSPSPVIAGPPAITQVSPATGPAPGGTTVIVKGTNFTDQTQVTFGGLNPASVIVNGPTQITVVTAPQPAGKISIVVKTDFGLVALANGFTYTAETVEISQAPTNFNYSGKLTGKILTLKSTFSVGIKDLSGSGAGWHLVARSTVLRSDKAVIPVANHTIQNVKVVTKNGTPPQNKMAYPLIFPVSDNTIFSAAANSGAGESIITFETQLVIPPDIPAGNYTLTLNVSVEAGA